MRDAYRSLGRAGKHSVPPKADQVAALVIGPEPSERLLISLMLLIDKL